jgi:hypothetical protein
LKKLILILCLTFALTLPAFAVEGIVWSHLEVSKGDAAFIKVTATVTTAANGSLTTTLLGGTAGGDKTAYDVRGYYLHNVAVLFGLTAPTINSDLYLLEESATGRDILGGAGLNIVDDTTNSYLPATIGSTVTPIPVVGHLYLSVLNNIVDTALFTVILIFVSVD